MQGDTNDTDVIVLGDHSCTYIAATLLVAHGVPRVRHVVIPTDPPANRAVLINPDLFKLHKLLTPLREAIPVTPVNGVQFLCDDRDISGKYSDEAPIAYVARLLDVNRAAERLAEQAGVKIQRPVKLVVGRTNPQGVELQIDGVTTRATALIVGGDLPEACKRRLGIPLSWDTDVERRLYFVELPTTASQADPGQTLMSLDLKGTMQWAWMLSTPDARHLFVEQSGNRREPMAMLQHWANVLTSHGMLQQTTIDAKRIQCIQAPIAGALSQDSVCDRTVLIGPAGGFFGASGEDVFPSVWSAIHAAQVMREALKKSLLQDALDEYRSCWRTELGVYLQGPQQNLRLLLPMIYRNAAMTARLAVAILAGKSVIH